MTSDKMLLQVSVHHHRHGHDVHLWWIPPGCEPLAEKEIRDQLEDFDDDAEDEWVEVTMFDGDFMPSEENARAILEEIRKVVEIR